MNVETAYKIALGDLKLQVVSLKALISELEKVEEVDWATLGSVKLTATTLQEAIDHWDGIVTLVPPELACPGCNCQVMDDLILCGEDNDFIKCQRCGKVYGT